jgi:uncharacterized protein YdhG (YjbR/CyaY superfamily)
MKTTKPAGSIENYIKDYPPKAAAELRKIRNTIRSVLPKAKEAIKYGIPTFMQNGNLIHFGGFKDHISVFPYDTGMAKTIKGIEKYVVNKGTVSFPLDKPVPQVMIKQIAKFLLKRRNQRTKQYGSI